MRQPDQIQVFGLGYYEQMLLARAVMVSTDTGPDVIPLTPKERADLSELAPIFTQPGAVTILKGED